MVFEASVRMKSSARARPPFKAIWKAGADAASRRNLLGLWCWRYRGIPARNLFRRLLLPRVEVLQIKLRGEPPLRLSLRRNDRGGHASFFEIFFELPWQFSLPRSPQLIADAGAHIGCFSLYAHRQWPDARIVAFEPEENNQVLLRRNFSDNGIRGEVCGKAVWKETTELEFASGESNSGYLTAGTKQQGRDTAQATRRVPAISLRDYFGDELKKLDVLKLDVEGAELEVLETELPHLSPQTVVLCELHYVQANQRRFVEILARHGWRSDLHDDSHPPHATWILRKA